MKKVITKFVVIVFAFAFPFLFCACGYSDFSYKYMIPTYETVSQKGGDGEIPGIEYKKFDPEFYTNEEEGWLYTYFAGYWEDYEGVRIASNPKTVNSGDNVKEETKQERQKYFDSVFNQFELLYYYIKNYMLCQFDEKVNDIDFVLESGAYQTTFKVFEPTVLQGSTEEEIEFNKKIGNSTAEIMGGSVCGWTYSNESGNYVLSVNRNTDKKFDVDFKNGHEQSNKNFVLLRLMEIILDSQTKSTYGFASVEHDTTGEIQKAVDERIQTYMSSFLGLGFSFEEKAVQFKKFLEEELIGISVINYYHNPQRTFSEPFFVETFVDANGNGSYDVGESFVDANGNGFYDGMIYFDINRNGMYDESFTFTGEEFVYDFSDFLNSLTSELSAIVDGEEYFDLNSNKKYDVGELFIDKNRNEVFDGGYPKIISVEAQDILSFDMFQPGIAHTETNKRMLTNMNYSDYKSAVFLPNNRITFDTLDIYIDSETDFVLDLYLKVYINEDINFICHICSLALDNSKDCDWANEESEKTYENVFEEFFDSDVKHNAFTWMKLEDLFSYVTGNRPNDYILNCKNQGSLTDAEAMYYIVSKIGALKMDEHLVYQDRGYHTNLEDNLDLSEHYSYQEIDKNGTKALCYNSNKPFVEFVFNVQNRETDKDYNFKFLIQTPTFDSIDEDEEE